MFNNSDIKEVFVYTYSPVAIQAKGRIAMAQIVFHNGSYVCMIYQAFPDGSYRWRPPYLYLQQTGIEEENVAQIGGPVMNQLAQVAANTQVFIKTKFPEVPTGTTFRVTREDVQIVPNPPAGLVTL